MDHIVYSRLGISSRMRVDFEGIGCGIYLDQTIQEPKKGKNPIIYVKDDDLFFSSSKGKRILSTQEIIGDSNNYIQGRRSFTNAKNFNLESNQGPILEGTISIGDDSFTHITDSFNIGFGSGIAKELKTQMLRNNILIGHDVIGESENGKMIDNIIIGDKAAGNMTGVNHQNILLGRRVGYNLTSSLISDNNIIFGNESCRDASNISESIIVGTSAAGKVRGIGFIGLGPRVFDNTTGELNYDIAVGAEAGSNRAFFPSPEEQKSVPSGSITRRSIGTFGLNRLSENIFIGRRSGSTSVGLMKLPIKRVIAIGSSSGFESMIDESILIGTSAGEKSKGSLNLFLGFQSGKESDGQENVYLGSRIGLKQTGHRNFFAGSSISCTGDISGSVLIGSGIKIQKSDDSSTKLKDIIAIGTESGSSLSRGIFIGFQSGSGNKFSSDSVNWISIGAHAGQSQEGNCGNSVIIGNDAGRSDEAEFDRVVIVGHFAGSFAGATSDTVMIGHNAGLGSKGDHNTFIGSSAGFSSQGEGNIFIGSKSGDNLGETHYRFEVSSNSKILLSGNIDKCNLSLGKYIESNSKGCLWLPEDGYQQNNTEPAIYRKKETLYFGDKSVLTRKVIEMKLAEQIEVSGSNVLSLTFCTSDEVSESKTIIRGTKDFDGRLFTVFHNGPIVKIKSKQNGTLIIDG